MIASMSICNTFGIIILDIEYGIDDYIIFKYSNETKKRRSKIRYTSNNRPYFLSYGHRYYLDEFIREGI